MTAGTGDLAASAELEAVFFDVGGPIYPDESFAAAVLGALDELREDDGHPPVDRAQFQAIYDDQRARQSGSLRRRLAAELLGDETLRSELHRRTSPRWVHQPGSLYPDVLPCLRSLHGHVRIGIVANQEASVVDALRRDGVADLVDVWAVSALVGLEKPDPELFRWALRAADADPHRAAHVGNRLDTDVRPAAALGLRTVWVLRGEAPDEPTPEQCAVPDVVVRDLADVPRLLLGERASRMTQAGA